MPRSSASEQGFSPQHTRFRPEFLDFRRGIRVGNLNDDERITRILKLALEARYRQSFVTERWGRGVYWQWIGYLAKANRAAMPLSSKVSFGCAKFFLMIDTDDQRFKCGLQVERGLLKAPPGQERFELRDDWDWHRLLQALKPKGAMERELKRLVMREGFWIQVGGLAFRAVSLLQIDPSPGVPACAPVWSRRLETAGPDFCSISPWTRMPCAARPEPTWWNPCWPFSEEVTPAMRLCIQTPL